MKITISILLISTAFTVHQVAWGLNKNEQSILDKKVLDTNYDHIEFSAFNSFLRLCSEADIPCGIEYLPNADMQSHLIEAEVPYQSTVLTSLKNLVAKNQEYRWYITRGVVDLVPRKGLKMKHQYSSPLDRMVGTIDLNHVPAGRATVEVCRQSGLQCGLIETGGGLSLSGTKENRRQTVTIHLSDRSVRDALNEIVRQDGHSVWGFFSTGSGVCKVGLVAQWGNSLN